MLGQDGAEPDGRECLNAGGARHSVVVDDFRE